MNIFDLDGTLLDVWKRYFLVFNSWWKIRELDINTFISLKREVEDDLFIIKKFYDKITEKEYNLYKKYKRENLEKPEYLRLDEDIVNWNDLKNLDFIILTVRNNKYALYNELERRGLDFILEKIIVLKPKDYLVKYNWVVEHLNYKDDIYVVGDSETDLFIGKLQKVKVVLVKTGLRDPINLVKKYSKELVNEVSIVNSVNDFLSNFPLKNI